MNRFDDGTSSAPATPQPSGDHPVLNPKTEAVLVDYAIEIGRVQVRNRELAAERKAKAAERERAKTLAHAEKRIPFGWTSVRMSGGGATIGYEIALECLVPLPCAHTEGDLVVERIQPRTDLRVAPDAIIRTLLASAKTYPASEPITDPEVMKRATEAAMTACAALRDFDERHELEKNAPALHRINVSVALAIAIGVFGHAPDSAARIVRAAWCSPWIHANAPRDPITGEVIVQRAPHAPLTVDVAELAKGAPLLFDHSGLLEIVTKIAAERDATQSAVADELFSSRVIRTTPRAANVIVLRKPAATRVRPVHRVMVAGELQSEEVRSSTVVRDGEARQCFARVWPFGIAPGLFEEIGAMGPSWIIVGDDEEIDLTQGEIQDAQRRPPRVALLHQLASDARTQPEALEPITDPIDLRSQTASRKAIRVFRSHLKGPLGEMAFGREGDAAQLLRWVLYGIGGRGCSLLAELVAAEIANAFKRNKAAADVVAHIAGCRHVQEKGGYCAPGALIETKSA